MYRVVKYFTDLQDGNHPYNVGDAFPREGLGVTKERFAELAGSGNRQGVPLIEAEGETATETPAAEAAAGNTARKTAKGKAASKTAAKRKTTAGKE